MAKLKSRRTLLFVAACVLLAVGVICFAWWMERPVTQSFGVTFSTRYARELGLDSRETFLALLDELGARRFRIPVYWSEGEPVRGSYQWDELDWMMRQAETRGAEVTLAVGVRLPRWPECHIPPWALSADGTAIDRGALDAFLTAVVERYGSSAALSRWQVENEPYLRYGVCPHIDREDVDREVALVHSLDTHPVVLTVSGELQRWRPSAAQADLLGVSLYRVTWHSVFGYFRYPLPPAWYRFRAWLARPLTGGVFISELQAEPWFSEAVINRSPAEWYERFTEEDLRRNVDFAARTGMAEVDLWGAEWWLYLKTQGEPRLWEEAKRLFGGMI